MVTDTTEKGLEALITNSLISKGRLLGDPQDYDLAHCVDLSNLSKVPQRPSRNDGTLSVDDGTLSVDTDTPREGGALGQRLLINPSKQREAIAMDLGADQGPDKPAEARHQFRDRPTGLPG